MPIEHILWVNEVPRLMGGCEGYIYRTVKLLRERGVRNSFLYHGSQEQVSTEFLRAFDGAYPLIDAARQVAEIDPDLIYLHRWPDTAPLVPLAATGRPVLRFFHDHDLFCLRRYRYKALTHATCTKPIGFRCYPCLGFVNRADNALGLSFRTVGGLRREQRANLVFDGFVVGSQYMKSQIAEHGFPADDIHVIPYFSAPPQNGTPVQREDDLIVFVGQLVRAKGVDILLRAMKLIERPCRLQILGTGKQEQEWRELSDALGLQDRVEFLGHVPHEELPQYYKRAACVVAPSRWPEPFGMVGPEAMSYGAPVVSSNVGGPTEWLLDGETGYQVPTNDPQALADALERTLDDPVRGAAMGEAGRRRYFERYQPERHVDDLLAVFERALAT